MANTVTKQLIQNGSKYYVTKVTIIGDGSGEETATLLNTTSGDLGTNSKIISVTGALSGFSARLLFDATIDEYAMQIPSDHPVDFCFRTQGGVISSQGAGITGNILITTAGLGAGDSGFLLLEISKS